MMKIWLLNTHHSFWWWQRALCRAHGFHGQIL